MSFRAFLVAFVALVCLTPTSRGEFIITFSQNGVNVDAQGTGSINTAALMFIRFDTNGAVVDGNVAEMTIGQPGAISTEYSGITGPTSFGTAGMIFASSGIGGAAGLNGEIHELIVPVGYPSGTTFTASATWDNQTISGLGLTPGTYTWTWGSGATADDLKVVIPSATAVPEPSSLILAGTALGVVGLCRGIRRRRDAAAAGLATQDNRFVPLTALTPPC